MDTRTDLEARVERWLAVDPDQSTRARLRALWADDPDAVAALFDGRLAFGTAGLRAPLGPGPTRMNRVVVRQTTAGLMDWLDDGATVVIGYDARHGSADFAADGAEVVARCGGTALLLPEPLPTPVLAHAVLSLRADAGVMITASHNPADDNGYKLYLADGIQLVPPADREIAAAIEAVAAATERGDQAVAGRTGLQPAATSPTGSGPADGSASPVVVAGDGARLPGRIETLGPEVAERHLDAAVAACVTDQRQVRMVCTPLHGVGGRHLLAALERAGFPPPHVVTAQFDPDPDFPTVAFPNPEEVGALDLALDLAAEVHADVVLANDPDGDRLAVAVPGRDGSWVRLSGDQVGILLTRHLLDHSHGDDRLVASSIVSSRMISSLAAERGVADVRTLTGFKWVARPIVDRPDRRYVFGYEEALGYCVGDRVRDKDGISAALVMAELMAATRAAGRTPWDLLDELAATLGVHRTAPVTVRFEGDDGAEWRRELMDRAAAEPPDELAGVAVAAVEDLSLGVHLPPTTGVVWDLADRSRVIVRPSGTEPKLKAYVEVIEPVEPVESGNGGTALALADERAGRRLDALCRAVAERLEA